MPTSFNAGSLLEAPVWRTPEKTALIFEDTRLTFAELDAGARRCAAILASLGVQAGDRVVLLLPDCPVFVQAILGTMRLGAIAIPVNPGLAETDLRHILDDSGAVVVATQSGASTLGFGGKVLPCGPRDFAFPAVVPLAGIHPSNADDLALMLYTSGSTGRPKGVPHRHGDLLVMARQWAPEIVGDLGADTILCTSKLSFAYGLLVQLCLGLAAGATVVQHGGAPEPGAVFALLARHRPTLLFAVPTVYATLIRAWPATTGCAATLRLCYSSGENLPISLHRHWQELTGQTIVEGIGSTEALGIYISNRPGRCHPGTLGEPLPGYEIRLVDPAGQPVASGQEGRMLLRGPGLAPAYWNRPEATAANMLPEGWFNTGDLCVEEQGRYRHLGRADDMMKIGGQWLSPIPVEDCLRQHPAVADCAVAGCHVQGLEYPAAFVVTRAGHVGNATLGGELRRFVHDRLPKYMCPVKMEFLAALPRTTTGKIQRHKLRH